MNETPTPPTPSQPPQPQPPSGSSTPSGMSTPPAPWAAPAPPALPSPYTYPYQKPGMVTAIAILTLISGIVNILWGIGAAIGLIVSIVGILCLPIAVFPIALGVLEIIYAAKLLPTPAQPTQPARYIAIMEICAILLGNVFSLVAGILALVFYNDPAVQAYFAYLKPQPQPSAPPYSGGRQS